MNEEKEQVTVVLSEGEAAILAALHIAAQAAIEKIKVPELAYLAEIAKRYGVVPDSIKVSNNPQQPSQLIMQAEKDITPTN